MLNTDIPGRWTCTNFCDIPILNQICQSPFHGNFAYIRTKLHDFFLCNLADLVINNCFNSIRLRKTAMLQMFYTAFKFISGLLFDAGSAEVFCTILRWRFPGLFPENRCEITLTGKRQGSRNYRDRIIGMAKHILGGLYFFALYIGTDRNSHLFCEQAT